MATVIFCINPYRGVFYAILKMANALKSAGYRIVYFGTSDLESFILKEGFEFENLCPIIFENNIFIEDAGWKSYWKYFNLLGKRYKLFSSLFNRSIDKYNPTLLLVDAEVYNIIDFLYCFYAYAKKINYKVYRTNVLNTFSQVRPKYCSNLIPQATLLSKFIITLSWAKWFFNKRAGDMISDIKYLGKRDRKWKKLARYTGFPKEKLRYDTWPLRIEGENELLLYPKEFDFNEKEKYIYVGNSVYTNRNQVSINTDKILTKYKHIIICSLGTKINFLNNQYIKFYNKIIQASQCLNDC